MTFVQHGERVTDLECQRGQIALRFVPAIVRHAAGGQQDSYLPRLDAVESIQLPSKHLRGVEKDIAEQFTQQLRPLETQQPYPK